MTEEETLRRLSDLVTYPKEDLATELKGWLNLKDELDKSNLAQAVMAMANHGGGYVLIGFTKHKGEWLPAEPRPADLSGYSVDDCNAVLDYAEPRFHCDVYFPARSGSDLKYPVVVVPGNHRVPIRARKRGPAGKHVKENEYYIRRPGPSSEPPRDGQEWDALMRRCLRVGREDLLEDFRRIMSGPSEAGESAETVPGHLDEWDTESEARWKSRLEERFPSVHQSPYAFGQWILSYELLGELRSPSLSPFMKILDDVRGHETGWPPWWVPTRQGIMPYPHEGCIECWLVETDRGNDPAHADFWRASPEGRMWLVRGYQEDSSEQEAHAPRTIFDLTLPVWRVGEVLLHAHRLASPLTGENSKPPLVHVRMRWTGLQDRELKSWAQPSIFLGPGRICHQESVDTEVVVPSDAVPTQLPEIVARLTLPLYEAFDFFQPSIEMYEEQLSRMRSKRI